MSKIEILKKLLETWTMLKALAENKQYDDLLSWFKKVDIDSNIPNQCYLCRFSETLNKENVLCPNCFIKEWRSERDFIFTGCYNEKGIFKQWHTEIVSLMLSIPSRERYRNLLNSSSEIIKLLEINLKRAKEG